VANIDGDDAENFLNGTSAADVINGFAGNDVLFGDSGDDTLNGGAGFDTLDGGTGDDVLDGGADLDLASFQMVPFGITIDLNVAGPQAIGGAFGFDTLISIESVAGTSYNDTLIGNGDVNNLIARGGNDIVLGGAGTDPQLNGGPGDDILDGGPGIDTASYNSEATGGVTVDLRIAGPQAVGGGLGIDTLISIESLRGSNFADTLIGDDQDNVLAGLPGNDILDGGLGIDMASYAPATSSVTVNLAKQNVPQLISAQEGNDRLIGIENVRGSIYNDRLTGNAGANLLQGGSGDDIVDGGRGNDTVTGGPGADVAKGGAGADVFLFLPGQIASGPVLDRIGDFNHRQGDTIDLSGLDAVEGGGDDGFSFIGGGSFSSVAGELHCVRSGRSFVLEGDTDGDGAADFAISLLGVRSLLQLSDFIL
jgi:Ca2+-binding RTX toxin-like protein